MIRLLVLYGHPTDPAEFDRYYHEVHIPIAKRMSGLTSWTIGKVAGRPTALPPRITWSPISRLRAARRWRRSWRRPPARPPSPTSKFATGGVTFLYADVEEVDGRQGSEGRL